MRVRGGWKSEVYLQEAMFRISIEFPSSDSDLVDGASQDSANVSIPSTPIAWFLVSVSVVGRRPFVFTKDCSESTHVVIPTPLSARDNSSELFVEAIILRSRCEKSLKNVKGTKWMFFFVVFFFFLRKYVQRSKTMVLPQIPGMIFEVATMAFFFFFFGK
jgi:hypothetical protein